MTIPRVGLWMYLKWERFQESFERDEPKRRNPPASPLSLQAHLVEADRRDVRNVLWDVRVGLPMEVPRFKPP